MCIRDRLKNCSLENIEYPNNYAIPVLHQTKILINDGEYNQIYDYKKGQLVAGIKLEVTKDVYKRQSFSSSNCKTSKNR